MKTLTLFLTLAVYGFAQTATGHSPVAAKANEAAVEKPIPLPRLEMLVIANIEANYRAIDAEYKLNVKNLNDQYSKASAELFAAAKLSSADYDIDMRQGIFIKKPKAAVEEVKKK